MYTDNTKRRSLINRFLPSVVVSLICLFIASPFVFGGGDLSEQFLEIRQVKAYSFGLDLKEAGIKAGFRESARRPMSLPAVIGLIIKSAIALIGLVFLILIIIAGLRWMWSGGDEETIKAAKKTIRNSALGAVIALGAYAITSYVMQALF